MGELGELDGEESLLPETFCPPFTPHPIEFKLPIDVFLDSFFFCGMLLSHTRCLYPMCFSPPPGKLARKTGAQKAAKRSRQPLSTPNACAAGYPPTPC